LQRRASYFRGQKSIDPNTGKEVAIIEEPKTSILIQEATYAFIYQYKFFLSTQDNLNLKQAMETLGQLTKGK
jgi:hypothetical protein